MKKWNAIIDVEKCNGWLVRRLHNDGIKGEILRAHDAWLKDVDPTLRHVCISRSSSCGRIEAMCDLWVACLSGAAFCGMMTH